MRPKRKVTVSTGKRGARENGSAKREDLWDAGWSKSLVDAFESELASYSPELRDTYYSPWAKIKIGLTSRVGSPIEHLMRMRRFEGGVEELFQKVDEAPKIKVENFFPRAYMRYGHGVVPCVVNVSPQADQYLKEMAKKMDAGLGEVMDKICAIYRGHVAQLRSPAGFQASGVSDDISVKMPMSTDSFVFIDRLASQNGTGSFAITARLVIEYALLL